MDHQADLTEMIIPKEKAVFWMDGRGRWCNHNGPFQHKKIINHFNTAIQKDDIGFFVTQVRDAVREKVYFRYEDTALFVVDIIPGDPIELVLNTKAKVELVPEKLFIRKDNLFMSEGELLIKFNERTLLKIAEQIVCHKDQYSIQVGGRSYPISEH